MDGVLITLAAGLLYFLPALVAVGRHHPNVAPIFALDLLLGWTVLGWVAALVWSLTATPAGRAS